jgi:hypothetical protein
MSLADILIFVIVLFLIIYLIRIVPLPSPGPQLPGQPTRPNLEWIRIVLIIVVVICAIIYLVTGGHNFIGDPVFGRHEGRLFDRGGDYRDRR